MRWLLLLLVLLLFESVAASSGTGIKLEVCLDGNCNLITGVQGMTYSKLFKVTNLDHITGQTDNISVSVDYNITAANNSLVKTSNFTVFVNSYTTANTGEWASAVAGNYTICGNITATSSIDNDTTDNVACKNIEIISPNDNACDLSVDIDATKQIYNSNEQIDYSLLVEDINCSNISHSYIMQYQITDLFGNYLKMPYNSTYQIVCSDKSSHTKQAGELCGSEAYLIKAEILQNYCNDSNADNDAAEFLIVVKGASACDQSGTNYNTNNDSNSAETKEIEVEILDYNNTAKQGDTITTKARITNNKNTTEAAKVYSYVFQGSSLASEGGWTGNSQNITLEKGETETLELENKIKDNADIGIYSLRIRFTAEDGKKYDATSVIEILENNNITNTTAERDISQISEKQNASAVNGDYVTGALVWQSKSTPNTAVLLFVGVLLILVVSLLLSAAGAKRSGQAP
jgi:hypothetical protein